jgi:hypothetical protein
MARKVETMNAYIIVEWKPLSKRPLGRPTRRWKITLK